MATRRIKLHSVAHARTGDKGDRANVSLIAYDPEWYPVLAAQVTASRVAGLFAHRGSVRVARYELPHLQALNFVIDHVLEGGVNSSLNLDGHGKALSFLLLSLTIRTPAGSKTPRPRPGAHSDPRFTRGEYISRVNLVIDHIEANLGGDLDLAGLARVAGFSRFHFHRIFRGLMGETLSRFIQRLRLEKAARLLAADPGLTITDIAFSCGFSGSDAFARAFKESFKLPPSHWRAQASASRSRAQSLESKTGQKEGKPGQATDTFLDYPGPHDPLLRRREEMKEDKRIPVQVEVKDLEPLEVAYVRHIGPYAGDNELFGNLIQKLMTWAGPRGLTSFPESRLLAVYHDNPDITEEDKLRTSVCLTVPPETKAEGEIGRMNLPGGKYALARVEIDPDQYEAAWDSVYGGWLPESGYQPDDRPSMEFYLGDPNQHPEGKHVVEICVPVKPM